MKRIYTILLVAAALSIGSCDIESNARYTGNYYSANTPKEQQANTTEQQNAKPAEAAIAPTTQATPIMRATGRSPRVTN